MIPNIITLGRLILSPILIYVVLTEQFRLAFTLFVIAGVSDALDGFIAKRFNVQSKLGAFLDPLADKCLLVGLYVTLGYIGVLPVWLVIMVVFRDLVIVGGVILIHLVSDQLKMDPLKISKINTALQILLVAYVLFDMAYGLRVDEVTTCLVLAVAVTTTLSGLQYVRVWWERLNRSDEGGVI